ncbi:hypothetical protein [Pseudoxanthomonas sp. Root630]|uniref:hypothetical protein n=1 Tax=Pseudoxanthomonas sp. Root630 TaxID=1736574 RepID=UPI00138F3734|nr:hypothetical protein [Pseudoxanthomonas sp. Root630]
MQQERTRRAVTDDVIIGRAKRVAFCAWGVALVLGLSSGAARYAGRDMLADVLFALVWCAGGVFVICWFVLAISTLILIASRFTHPHDK